MQGPLMTGYVDSGVRREERRLEPTGIEERDEIGQNVGMSPLDVDRQANQIELLFD